MDAPITVVRPAEATRSWRDHWYPVAFEEDLPRDRPYAFTLFGEPLVLFLGEGGRWFCGADRCPHRAARLSEGQMRDGQLACLYHGWQFDAAGQCTHIPQWPQDKPRPAAACLKRHPLETRQGMVWIWPGKAGEAHVEAIPTLPELDRSDMVCVDYLIDLPYGQSFLIENVIDVAHIHIAHHGMRGGGHRDLALPLEFDILEDSAAGLRATYRSVGLPVELNAGSPGKAFVEFRAPNLVLYTSAYEDTQRIAGLALYSLPLEEDRCRLLYRKFSNFYSKEERSKPRWEEHWTQNEILRQDMSLIIGQHDEIRRSHQELKDLWLPLKSSDALVVRYRKWLDLHAADRPDHRGFATHRDRPAPARTASVEAATRDLFATHTRHCSACTRAHTQFRRAERALQLAMVAAVPVMAMGPLSLQLASLGLYALAGAAFWQVRRLRQRFEHSSS